MISITIDGNPIIVKEGTTLLSAAKHAGCDIPSLCQMNGYEECISCGICVVEIEGFCNLIPAYSTIATHGMIIKTRTEEIIKARQQSLYTYMSKYPNDCFSCNEVGKCKLQEYCNEYGFGL